MTMPASGKITLFDARTELGLSGKISLQQSEVRGLFDVPSGAISLFDGYGKMVQTYPTFVAVGALGITDGVTLTVPAVGGIGGFLLLQISCLNSAVISSPPSGWTLLVSAPNSNSSLFVYYRFDSGSPSATLTFESQTTGGCGVMYRFDKVAQGIPVVSSVSTGSMVTSVPIPQLTTTKDKSLVLSLVSWKSVYAGVGNITNTPPAGLSEICEKEWQTSGYPSVIGMTQEVPVGAIVPATITTASQIVYSNSVRIQLASY